MFSLSVPWWELVARSAIVYAFLLILLRVTGKRQVGQLAPFDLVLLLVLSNAVQNSMNAGDNSLIGGLIAATTLVVLNGVVGYVTYRSKRLEALVEGRPQVLIHNGRLYQDALESARLTRHELNAALRASGCAGPDDVEYAVLENNGSITVLQRARERENEKTGK
ncbi:MAG TPA: YetF domain-containing protein [Gemmatimonadaceae bacterium]|nr:YetF domain-containing protein [Gemmatimonadaceae bacterium]